MLELARAEVVILDCLAQPEALDGLSAPGDAFACRVAADELLLVAGADAQEALLAEAAALLEGADPDALVLDQTASWSVWTLAGPDVWRAFARLSAIELLGARPDFVQGAIAGVPAKALLLTDRIHVMVPASAGHHLRERVLTACSDLEPHEGGPRPLELSMAAVPAQLPGGAS